MKRTWICGVCAIAITGGAITLAQQDGGGAPPAPPISAAGNTAPLQDLPSASAPVNIAPAGGVEVQAAAPASTAPTAGVAVQASAPSASPVGPAITTQSSNDPFGRASAAPTIIPSANPFGQAPAKAGQASASDGTWDEVPSQNGQNFGRAGGGGRGYGSAARGGNFGGGQGTAFGPNRFGSAMNLPGGQNVSNMMISAEAKAYHDAEQKVTQLAARINSMGADHPSYPKTDEELKAAVKAAFEARQAMQKAEVKRLKDKLAEIETHVSRREGAKEVLIEERLYDLKNGSGRATPFDSFSPISGAFPAPGSYPIPDPVPFTGAVPSSAFDGGNAFNTTPVESTTPPPADAPATTEPAKRP